MTIKITDAEYAYASECYYTFLDSLSRMENPPHLPDWEDLPNHIQEVWINAVDATDEFIFNEEEQNG